ncbi:MAG TPA: hypothetical protein PLI18_07510 [Pirellulaceae bacterium]|nr:hypothetical protein [Pirellulaceae bacterium]
MNCTVGKTKDQSFEPIGEKCQLVDGPGSSREIHERTEVGRGQEIRRPRKLPSLRPENGLVIAFRPHDDRAIADLSEDGAIGTNDRSQ